LQAELVEQAEARNIPDVFAMQVVENYLSEERMRKLPTSFRWNAIARR
jgi:hypothetical protein